MGLVDYDSDSDGSGNNSPVPVPIKQKEEKAPRPPSPLPIAEAIAVAKEPAVPSEAPPEPSSDAPLVGPARPPAEYIDESLPAGSDDEDAAPLSPYTANRNLIHSLTLPPSIGEIPPSPPGSPKPALEQKFAHFRDLKSQGIHFNEKLLRSSALNNPNLLQKLSAFVGLEKEDFYGSNLDPKLWDPKAFPSSAYTEALDKMQEKVAREREEKKARESREKVEFVRSVEPRESRWGVVDRVHGAREKEDRNTPNVRDSGSRNDGKEERRSDPRRDGRDGRFRHRDRDWDRRQDDRDRKRRRSRSSSRMKEREEDREGRYRDYEYRGRR